MDNDVLTRNENGELSVRTVSATEQANVVNPDDVYTRTTEGYLAVRTVGNGGSGGGAVDSVNGKTGVVVLDAEDVGALANTTKYVVSASWTIDPSTYVMTLQLKDQDGANIGTAQTIDLPLESVVVGGSYDSTNKNIILTLNNGTTIDVPVADLVSGLQSEITAQDPLSADLVDDTNTTHKFVSAAEKSTWNNKQDAISDLATIRSGAAAGATAIQSVKTINGQSIVGEGNVDIDSLPDQTGNAGKFLITDGTDASWSDKPLVNLAKSGSYAQVISRYAGNVNSLPDNNCLVLTNTPLSMKPSIGSITITESGGAATGSRAITIGYNATASGNNSIQISTNSSSVVNSDANTFKVANANGNFELMSADGTIPKERLINVVTTPSTMPELTVAGWSNNTQTVNVTGVSATNTVFVSPAPASAADYAAAGIVCTAQAADSLTFTCQTTPTNAITVNIVIF